jgi:hypothetical protein
MQVHLDTRGNKLQNLAARKLLQHYKLEGLPGYRPASPTGNKQPDHRIIQRGEYLIAPANFGRGGKHNYQATERHNDMLYDHGPVRNIKPPNPSNVAYKHVPPPSRPGMVKHEDLVRAGYLEQVNVPREGVLSPKNPPRLGRSKKRAREG